MEYLVLKLKNILISNHVCLSFISQKLSYPWYSSKHVDYIWATTYLEERELISTPCQCNITSKHKKPKDYTCIWTMVKAMNKESFFGYYGVIILIGPWSNPIKPEWLYDTFDHATTIFITSWYKGNKYIDIYSYYSYI